MTDHKEKLITDGYTIIDDILPLYLAKSISEAYKSNIDWQYIDQIRPDHYGHVFKSDNLALPQESEVYTAKFNRSDTLRNSEIVKSVLSPVNKNLNFNLVPSDKS